MKIAYLVNIYPKTSHSFIRREILALESLGLTVARFTVRVRESEIVDPADHEELAQTYGILRQSFGTVLGSVLACLGRSPGRFVKTLGLAIKLSRGSERGLGIHLIYFVEACVLARQLAQQQIDHLHAHFGTNSTTVALLCEALGGPPFSFTVHGPEEFDKVAAIALPEKIRRAQAVMAISSYGRSQLYRWCTQEHWSKIHLVRCGLDPRFLDAQTLPLPDRPQWVCIGRLSEQKGQLLLIQALAQLKQAGFTVFLTLIGDGLLRPAIEQAIATGGLNDQITLTGWATETEVKAAIEQAQLMILPSFAEGLPVVIMESLALGRPVISTYIAGIPELVQPGISGWLVPAGDQSALVEVCQQALQTPLETLTHMGQAGRQAVLHRHNGQREAQKLVDIWRQTSETNPN